jgi:hypothetical protein
MIEYLKKLNWFGFSIVLLISMVGALSNEHVTSFLQWLILVVMFGIPFSLFFLFAGKKE